MAREWKVKDYNHLADHLVFFGGLAFCALILAIGLVVRVVTHV